MSSEKQTTVDMMERESVPVTIAPLPENEKLLFDGISRIYFYVVANNPITLACIQNIGGIDEPKNVDDAYNKILLIKKKLDTITDKIYIKKDVIIILFKITSSLFCQ